MAVKRDVGGIQIQHNLLRHTPIGLQKQLHQQAVQRFSRVADLVIAIAAANQFQPVQSALAGQRPIQLALAAEHRQQWIGAQLLMIAKVFVAQRQTENTLRQHLR
jgi:hypothetical protein